MIFLGNRHACALEHTRGGVRGAYLLTRGYPSPSMRYGILCVVRKTQSGITARLDLGGATVRGKFLTSLFIASIDPVFELSESSTGTTIEVQLDRYGADNELGTCAVPGQVRQQRLATGCDGKGFLGDSSHFARSGLRACGAIALIAGVLLGRSKSSTRYLLAQ